MALPKSATVPPMMRSAKAYKEGMAKKMAAPQARSAKAITKVPAKALPKAMKRAIPARKSGWNLA